MSTKDPIYVAIAAHKAAEAKFGLDLAVDEDTADSEPSSAALLSFLTTKPTTLSGIRAALSYAAEAFGQSTVLDEAMNWGEDDLYQAGHNFTQHIADAMLEISAEESAKAPEEFATVRRVNALAEAEAA